MTLPTRVLAALDRVNGAPAVEETSPERPRAVVVRTDDKHLSRCLDHATGHGYQVAVADAATALAMVAAGTADVIVAASDADLPYVEIAGARRAVPVPRPESPVRRRPLPLRGPFGD